MLTTVEIPPVARRMLTGDGIGPAGEAGREVFIQFAVASRAFGLTPAPGGPWRAHKDPSLPTVMTIARDALVEGEIPPLRVISQNEPAQAASIVFAIDAGSTAIVHGDSPTAPPGSDLAASSHKRPSELCGGGETITIVPGPPSAWLYDPPRYIAEMERLLSGAGPGQHERRFFFTLDRRTHPFLDGAAFAQLPGYSIVRKSFETRVRIHRERGLAQRPAGINYSAPKYAEFLNATFSIMEPLLDDLDDAVDDAMDHFANGALRLRLDSGEWTTQPSSGYFFLFGEIALLGVEFRDAALWLPFARAAIRAQEILAEVYFVDESEWLRVGLGDRYGRFGGCKFRVERQMPSQRRDELRESYARLDREQLQRQFAINARRLLYREPV